MLPSSDDPSLSNITYQQLAELYREQAAALIEGGVDLLLIETSQDILEVRAAITGIRRAFADLGARLPIQAQVTLDTSGRMLLGTDIAASSAILFHLGVDIAGLNCSTGPEHMREPVRYLTENLPLPISTIPNAGLPLNVAARRSIRCSLSRWPRRWQSSSASLGSTSSAAAAAQRPSISRLLPRRWLHSMPTADMRPIRRLDDFDPAMRARTGHVVASAVRANSLPSGSSAAPGRRAGQRPGQPQGEAGLACR